MKYFVKIFRVILSFSVLGFILYNTIPLFGIHIKYVMIAVFSTIIILGEVFYNIRKTILLKSK